MPNTNQHVAEPFRGILNRAAAISILNAAQPEVMGDMDFLPAKCPGYCCTNTLGPDSGIIDGTEYCADCVANEAEVAGREDRKRNAELFAIGHGDL